VELDESGGEPDIGAPDISNIGKKTPTGYIPGSATDPVGGPFGPSLAPDPGEEPTAAKRKAAQRQAIASVSPQGTSVYGRGGLFNDIFNGGRSDPGLPADEIEIGGKKYTFNAVTDQYHNVIDYVTQGESGPVHFTPDDYKYLKAIEAQNAMVPGKPGQTEQPGDPTKLSDSEYDALTKDAAKGNKLAQEILVKGHYKAQDYPSLTQDIAKLEDPFVQALSNLPNVAQSAEAQTLAVTKPYDFSNAESQVNNILANQGYAQLAQPSVATSSYVSKLDQLASGNPLTTSALGLPSITQALSGLGPAGKLAESAAPNAGLLSALLSHIQYEDIYGTGLSGVSAAQNPAWLQALLAAVTGQSNLNIKIPGLPSTSPAPGQSPDTVPNTG